MSDNLYFVISAVILSLTILASFYLKFKIPTKDNKLLMTLIWVIVVSNVVDFMLGVQEFYPYLGAKSVYLLNTLYFIGRICIITAFVGYIILCTNTQKVLSLKAKIVFAALDIYGIILIIGNYKCHWLFAVDTSGNYVRGEHAILFYLFALGYILFGIYHLLRYGKILDWSKKVSLYVFLALPSLGALLQYEMPGFLVESFAVTIGLLWIYLNVPRMERMLDSDTNALNQYAFSKKVEVLAQWKEQGYMLVLRFRDRTALKEKYGLDTYKKLMREVTVYLCKELGRENIYYLRDARFAVLIPQNKEEEAKQCAKHLFADIQKTWKIYGREINVWTVGALLELPDDVESINDVYSYLAYLEIMPSLQDGNLYEGKHLDIAYIKRYDEIERAIDRALQQTNFEVYYQPIYSTGEKRIVAAEALLRMHDEEMGFISPEEFIPIAEKNGKIIEIGHLVLEQVCSFLKREDIKKIGINYIEVNLSMVECMQENLPEELERIMEQYDVDKRQINLEITETALAQNRDILVKNMQEISEMGVTFSLDDYGTGYSTITYMMTMPFKIVKIDKSILWSSFENERAMIALRASIGMIKDMNMEIVVEGVESEEMVHELERLGCDYLQGYYYAKPMPEKEFLAFFEKNNKKTM